MRILKILGVKFCLYNMSLNIYNNNIIIIRYVSGFIYLFLYYSRNVGDYGQIFKKHRLFLLLPSVYLYCNFFGKSFYGN